MMGKTKFIVGLAAGLAALAAAGAAQAGDVKILAAEFRKAGDDRWSVNVTLKHHDTGWDHYADEWRVVDGQGRVLGDRVLYHPHVGEQPFTRGLDAVEVPPGVTTVHIEAHDKVHGWSPQRLTVDLSRARDGRVRAVAE